jgi:hypothetical protein
MPSHLSSRTVPLLTGLAAFAVAVAWRASGERRSLYSHRSLWSILSASSVLSVGSAASILSLGSFASVLSIGSSNSLLSIGSDGGCLSIGYGRRPSAQRRQLREVIR